MISEGSNNGMYMPVAPAYGNGNGWGGNDGWWIILLLLACGGGWGGFGGMGGWGGMMGMGMMDGMWSFPWILNGQNNLSGQMSDGFRDQMLNTSLNSIQGSVTSGFGDVQTALCGGFAGVNASINGAQNALAQQLYTNQISDLERSFAAQTATTAGFTGVQSGLCDIRYGNATNTRDIIESQNRGTQAVIDKLCQLEIDGVRRELAAEQRENANLRSDLMYARGQASQVAQTAELRQSGANQLNQLVSELRSCPIPAQPVYGNQPIFQCSGPAWNNNGCGCGNGFAA
ncbi:MAG: hypothetical protein VZQ75_00230 [Candidatus Faecousia sp.]|nr:hypothetical protein [Candidatus Faecousia sp.]